MVYYQRFLKIKDYPPFGGYHAAAGDAIDRLEEDSKIENRLRYRLEKRWQSTAAPIKINCIRPVGRALFLSGPSVLAI